jgi:hypothetical protein
MRSSRPLSTAHLLSWVSLGWCVAAAVGCGGTPSGPPRYRVSGKVTFNGRPVAAGSISFTPDASQNNRGPGSFAPIRDGAYGTPRGQGTVGGPHVLTITGLDRLPGSGAPGEVIPPLFSSYPLKVDLPREDTTFDIDVPATAADPEPAARPGRSR